MICPYRKELIVNDQGGYKEVFRPCLERECPFFILTLTHHCWKVEGEIRGIINSDNL